MGEAQASPSASVGGLKAPAEPGQLGATKLLLRRVSVAVYILTQQSHLLHTLNTTPDISAFHLPLVYAKGVLPITSPELAKQTPGFRFYLIGQLGDLLQYGADGSTPLSSAGEGHNTVGAHVVATSHDGAASVKDPKLQAASHQRETGHGN